jgi:hypothetical protein
MGGGWVIDADKLALKLAMTVDAPARQARKAPHLFPSPQARITIKVTHPASKETSDELPLVQWPDGCILRENRMDALKPVEAAPVGIPFIEMPPAPPHASRSPGVCSWPASGYYLVLASLEAHDPMKNNMKNRLGLFIGSVRDNTLQIPATSPRIATRPIVGKKVDCVWSQASADLPAVVRSLPPKLGDLTKIALRIVAGIGGTVLLVVGLLMIACVPFAGVFALAVLVLGIAKWWVATDPDTRNAPEERVSRAAG